MDLLRSNRERGKVLLKTILSVIEGEAWALRKAESTGGDGKGRVCEVLVAISLYEAWNTELDDRVDASHTRGVGVFSYPSRGVGAETRGVLGDLKTQVPGSGGGRSYGPKRKDPESHGICS